MGAWVFKIGKRAAQEDENFYRGSITVRVLSPTAGAITSRRQSYNRRKCVCQGRHAGDRRRNLIDNVMKLPRLAIDNYQFTLMVFFLLLIMGVTAIFTMPRTEDPPMDIPGASIVVIYPGGNPVDMKSL